MSEEFSSAVWYTNELKKKNLKERLPIIFIPEEIANVERKILYGRFVYCGGVFTFVLEKTVEMDE